MGQAVLHCDKSLSWASPLTVPLPTSIKFLFHVSSLVCNEIGAVAEAFATLGALVGLLPCVDSLVYDEN